MAYNVLMCHQETIQVNSCTSGNRSSASYGRCSAYGYACWDMVNTCVNCLFYRCTRVVNTWPSCSAYWVRFHTAWFERPGQCACLSFHVLHATAYNGFSWHHLQSRWRYGMKVAKKYAYYYRLRKRAYIVNILWGKNDLHAFGNNSPKVHRFGCNLEQCQPNVGAGPGRIWARSARAIATDWEGSFFKNAKIAHKISIFCSFMPS